jgi:hypothetical protein
MADIPSLPFGQHRGVPLPNVPTPYLLWLLREVKLSPGLRGNVADELARRGVEAPQPPPYRPPTCQKCGPRSGLLASWMQDAAGKKRIRGECGQCRAYLGFLPQQEPYLSQANSTASAAPVLDCLTQAEAEGVALVSDGKVADFTPGAWRKASPALKARLRECRAELGRLMGDTRQDAHSGGEG